MDALRIIAENKIEEARSQGVFDNLQGYGKPIELDSVQPAGEDQFMANHILKTNHFLPVWLEDRKQLQQEINNLLELLKADIVISPERKKAIDQLNRRISGYNLRVPVESLRLMPVTVPEK